MKIYFSCNVVIQKKVQPVPGSTDILKAGGWVEAGEFWILPHSVDSEFCSAACAVFESKLQLLEVPFFFSHMMKAYYYSSRQPLPFMAMVHIALL